ncbi:FG-GAP repeat protein [Streptomyces sp. NPDC047315]|uniref:FG-GAP repeat protein n=1 Tax=Streptomyces sp. NPDC047315 TaxID=3155142 RepID=UPI0033C9AC1F
MAAATCQGGVDSDFNGDGVRDTAIADPEATVSGKERAGLVRIVLGGGKGVAELSQSTPNVSDAAEEGDRFGFSLAVYDANGDGCSDLAVGVPYEDVGTAEDAGLVHLLYGSPAGVAQGTPASQGLRQGADGWVGEHVEAGDLFGYSLATTVSATDVPYLVIGSPGEDAAAGPDIGMVIALYGADLKVSRFTQDSPGIWETAEPNDRFGYAIAAAGPWITVGIPGESIDQAKGAGAISVFRASINVDGIPDPAWSGGQTRNGVGDSSAEAGDGYGTSVAMVGCCAPFLDPGKSTEALIAVGVPGEDVGSFTDAGGVQVARVTQTGGATWYAWITQDTPGVEGDAEAGDRFGQKVGLTNAHRIRPPDDNSVRLVAGAPGEDAGADVGAPVTDVGGVAVLPFVGPPGATDVWLEPGDGVPATPADHVLTGLNLQTTGNAFYLGLPYARATDRAVHSYPWDVAPGGAPTQSWRPGEGGIPPANTAFGATIR